MAQVSKEHDHVVNNEDPIPIKYRNFSLCNHTETSSTAYLASIPVEYQNIFPHGVKRMEQEVSHSPLSTAEF
jgi:hypothetical protein